MLGGGSKGTLLLLLLLFCCWLNARAAATIAVFVWLLPPDEASWLSRACAIGFDRARPVTALVLLLLVLFALLPLPILLFKLDWRKKDMVNDNY